MRKLGGLHWQRGENSTAFYLFTEHFFANYLRIFCVSLTVGQAHTARCLVLENQHINTEIGQLTVK